MKFRNIALQILMLSVAVMIGSALPLDAQAPAMGRIVVVDGERVTTDLRYFEIEPGGHSSREFHHHTHVVIGARGTGVLVLGNERLTLARDDIAWIEPLEVHQLLNETDEPFGFYCMVDHTRDRPVRT